VQAPLIALGVNELPSEPRIIIQLGTKHSGKHVNLKLASGTRAKRTMDSSWKQHATQIELYAEPVDGNSLRKLDVLDPAPLVTRKKNKTRLCNCGTVECMNEICNMKRNSTGDSAQKQTNSSNCRSILGQQVLVKITLQDHLQRPCLHQARSTFQGVCHCVSSKSKSKGPPTTLTYPTYPTASSAQRNKDPINNTCHVSQ
jgi:hypothetical protein